MNCRWISLIIFILIPILQQAQPLRDFRKEAAFLKRILDENHFKPPLMDDVFSNEILESLLNQLDPNHLYFNESDIESLAPFRNSLDEEWKGDRWVFLKPFIELYRNSLMRGKADLSDEIKQNISWTAAEVFYPDGKNGDWSKTEG